VWFIQDHTGAHNITLTKSKRRNTYIPRKAAIQLTPRARKFFKGLLEHATNPDTVGIMLMYRQSSTGEPRMVFTFDFVTKSDVGQDDEGYVPRVQSNRA